ncbi:MAG TPA: hemerythrin family protein [Ignavibacteriaceae bacterium]|nr:hemerythrin family protein [Ignavibacteriaceae bacterium]
MELINNIKKEQTNLIECLHKKLIENINDLYSSVKGTTDKEKTKQILNTLVLNIIDHLKAEERLMQSLNHPDLDAHKVEHFSFLNQLLYSRKNYIEGKCTLTEESVKNIASWLEKHIREMNKRNSD